MNWAMKLFYLLIFIASMYFIITGQRNIGPAGLFTMIIGLFGILALLFLYNKNYK